MTLKLLQGLLIIIFHAQLILAQPGIYKVSRADFSSDRYDEFSPAYYKNGIVFCTNRGSNLIFNYSPSEIKGVFKIYFANSASAGSATRVRLFSKALKTNFNDGPACFNKRGDTIYFSRNIMTDNKLHDLDEARNKLGIFMSVFSGNTWTKGRELKINNEWYNVTTPWLSPDSKTLYFASDKPGGYGGSDLYYSRWHDGFWNTPVNMGPVINTSGNEAFPFSSSSGEIIFSSDGHKGMGGKDIFYSAYKDSAWLAPVPFDSPVNSEYDDFGLVMDSLMKDGYFSSNRQGSVDIFRFTTEFPQVFYTYPQQLNQYCIQFRDNDPVGFDKGRFGYQWIFGDGKKAEGEVVNHCFPGPGKYHVSLNLMEKATGRIVFRQQLYDVNLIDAEQPVINCPDESLAGKSITFDGSGSHLPGYRITDYYWYFGDGTTAKGANVSHMYSLPGEYTVVLGLGARQQKSSQMRQYSVFRKISISASAVKMTEVNGVGKALKISTPAGFNSDHQKIQVRYSAAEDLRKGAVFRVELLSSKNRILLSDPDLKKFSQKYSIRETYSKEDSLYRYVTDDERTIIEAFPVLTEAFATGFKSALIVTSFLTDPAEIALNTLKKTTDLTSGNFFERNTERLTPSGSAFLDQIKVLMNSFPGIRLFVEVHCDEAATDWSNQIMAKKRADALARYLVSKNINPNRFIIEGSGSTKRISGDSGDPSQKPDSRLKFRIIS